MEIRPVDESDSARLQVFFRRVPEGDRTFFKEDVLDPHTVASWARDDRGRRVVAIADSGDIVGYVAVLPGVGWSDHVGEVRLVVDPGYRGRGLGRRLARSAMLDAWRGGLRKLVVEVVSDQQSSILLFQSLGFEAEALLRDHVRDQAGHLRDLVILAHGVDDRWSELATMGIADAMSGG